MVLNIAHNVHRYFYTACNIHQATYILAELGGIFVREICLHLPHVMLKFLFTTLSLTMF